MFTEPDALPGAQSHAALADGESQVGAQEAGLGVGGHVVRAFTGVLEWNLLGHEPVGNVSSRGNDAENKVCAVVGTTATVRQTWELPSAEYNAAAPAGNHTLAAINGITFLIPPRQRNIKSQLNKKWSLSLKFFLI